MKKLLLVSSVVSLSIFVFSSFANFVFAHEHDTFKIGGKYYVFKVGSLNEPTFVDDKAGVDFGVTRVSSPSATDAGVPVVGLENTLKVEIGAGDKKLVIPLQPVDGADGSYTAVFIPTVETTYTYRFFGTIENNPVDLSFGCVVGDFSEDAQDKTQVNLSNGITKILKIGAYGCPEARASHGFPEPANSVYELNQKNQNLQNSLNSVQSSANISSIFGILGMIFGLYGIYLAKQATKK